MQTINRIIENSFNKAPDLISLDVEGLNTQIITSFDFSYRPKVFCIETIEYAPGGNPQKLKQAMQVLENAGYRLIADTYINSIFIDKTVKFK